MIHHQDLSHHPLRRKPEFEAFTDNEFQLLMNQLRHRQYTKGQILFNEEDPKHTLFYISEGLVKLERYDASGEYLYVDYVKKNRLFPYGDIFSGETYHYTASALTSVDLYAISFPLFEDILSHNASQLLLYYKKMSRILNEQERRIQFLVVSSAHARIVQSLRYLMTELGENEANEVYIPYPITINEIAALSGTSRETTGQTIKQLKIRGKLDYAHKLFTFKDVDYFKEYAS